MNDDVYKDILVYIEVNAGVIVENSLELLGEANRLKSQLGEQTKVTAAIMGMDVDSFAPQLFAFGADKVVYFNDVQLANYKSDVFGEALTQLIRHYKPEIVLIGATYLGAELAPTVAAKLKTGLAAHCTELRINESGHMVQVVPAFGGKVLGDIITPRHRPQMATVKAGITKKLTFQQKAGIMEPFHGELKGFGDQLQFVAFHKQAATGKPLNESDCIIGGGFGIGSKENWNMLEELAQLLNGATGCTRPALDEGWTIGEQSMIGTSGVAVRPKVYINAGISGAAHHTCGIKDAGLIISINKDANAPIFEVSDYKVVDDWKKIVPLLIQKLKSAK